MRHYAFYNLSRAAQRSAVLLFQTWASACELCLSVLLGIAIVDYIPQYHSWDLAFAASAICATIAARAVAVFPISWLSNLLLAPGKRPVSWQMQLVRPSSLSCPRGMK